MVIASSGEPIAFAASFPGDPAQNQGLSSNGSWSLTQAAPIWYGQRNLNRKDAKLGELEAEKRRQERVYVATVVVKHLETYINACVSAAYDDGTESGRPAGGNGYYQTTTPRPEFDAHKLDVNLQALPPALIYEVLSIQMRQEGAENYLDSPGLAGPPYDEYMWERGYQFAKLGQGAIDIAKRLRVSVGLPVEDFAQGWQTREQGLADLCQRYEDQLAARERHSREMMPTHASALQSQKLATCRPIASVRDDPCDHNIPALGSCLNGLGSLEMCTHRSEGVWCSP